MDSNRCLLEINNLVFGYRPKQPVLNGINLKLYQKQKIGITGKIGAGKSTLFQLIMGLIKPQSGNINIFSKAMLKEKDFNSIRTKVGLLFQNADHQLFSPTVLDDIIFGPLNQGKSKDEAKAIAKDLLHKLDLYGFESRLTYRLSGGEKKLVALASTLAMKPRMLLLDEPTNGIDESAKQKVINIIKDLKIPYIIISHDLYFLKEMVDSIYIIKDGRLHS